MLMLMLMRMRMLMLNADALANALAHFTPIMLSLYVSQPHNEAEHHTYQA